MKGVPIIVLAALAIFGCRVPAPLNSRTPAERAAYHLRKAQEHIEAAERALRERSNKVPTKKEILYMKAIIFDSETTGTDEPEVIETAWLPININGEIRPGGRVDRWKPSKPITLGAMAVHHIMDEHLHNAPPSSSFRLPDGVEYLIGHNIDFDWSAIGQPEVKRICTLALCRRLWPEADSHTQGAMIYLLHRYDARGLLVGAHSAGHDVMNCHRILLQILARSGPFDEWDQLWQLSERARIPTVMTFGKHKGMAVVDVPRDYKQWMLRQPDCDPYIRKAFEA